ncbi:hypothetical protein DBADOPDK_01842 [Pseudomonas sp. MM223]|nr:hypothetical protein DBADOPDK_01842 [Pseudomonas sp. MM223]
MTQVRIPAVFMRGGTSKGVFFLEQDVPAAGPERDALMLRVIGSPDPYGKQIDGMGAATSSPARSSSSVNRVVPIAMSTTCLVPRQSKTQWSTGPVTAAT